jgi:hypothetical protein
LNVVAPRLTNSHRNPILAASIKFPAETSMCYFIFSRGYFEYQNVPIHVMSHPYASVDFTALTRTFDLEKVVHCDEAKDQIWTCFASFNPSESIAPCILLIVVNVRTGTPSNPSKALENIGIVVGPILADADDAVVVDVRASYYSPLNTFLPCCNGGSHSSRSCRLFHLSLFGKHMAVVCRL